MAYFNREQILHRERNEGQQNCVLGLGWNEIFVLLRDWLTYLLFDFLT